MELINTQAVTEAVQAQRRDGFEVDAWIGLKLQPMIKLWQGIGGHSNFFLSEHDARDVMGTYHGAKPIRFAETLWRMAQVRPSQTRGFRQGIREFVVDLPVEVAVGVCLANDRLGGGTVFQYYIPQWEKCIFPTGRRHNFANKDYSQS